MTISRNPIQSNMQGPRGRSHGWAAFDRKQREKKGAVPISDADPFPSLVKGTSSGSARSFPPNRNAPIRTFSSVVRPSLDFPSLVGNCKGEVLNDSVGAETNVNNIKLLKGIHSWADQTLIEDILAAVNNDAGQASVLLKTMISPDAQIKEETNLSGMSSSTVNDPSDDKNKCSTEGVPIENNPEDGSQEVLASMQLLAVPIEPEWEEDDIYLSHRKDAIKMMRAASQHSRAASNAFSRGDHVSARQLSMKAQGEWMAAEKLNTKAAEEILRIRNSNNDVWKLDLHGLHATEAVSALKEHLHRLESQILMNRSASSNGLTKLESGMCSLSLESIACIDGNTKAKENKVLPRQRQTVLHVITGMGNHSRGQASLPMAVKSFLIDNGYRFDDARPGVVAVRPKFRLV